MKKKASYALLAIGILGFVYSQNIKSNYRIFSERVSSSDDEPVNLKLLNGHAYMFSLWGNDESSTMGEYASLEAKVTIQGSDARIIDSRKIIASGTEDKGGIRRAANGYDFRYRPEHSEQISLKYNLIEGDYLDIEIYEDLPENAYWMPVVFIAIFIAGFVTYLKSRAVQNHT